MNKISFFEPYALAKFSASHVYKPSESDFNTRKDVPLFRGDAVLGFNIWFTEKFGLNINAKWSSELNEAYEESEEAGENDDESPSIDFRCPSINLLWRS